MSDTPTENTRQALDKQEIPVTLITTYREHEQEKNMTQVRPQKGTKHSQGVTLKMVELKIGRKFPSVCNK